MFVLVVDVTVTNTDYYMNINKSFDSLLKLRKKLKIFKHIAVDKMYIKT